MIKRLLALFLTALFVCFSVPLAMAEEQLTADIVCTKGMIVSADTFMSKGAGESLGGKTYAVCPSSYGVIRLDGGIVDVAASTWVDCTNGVFLKEGVVAVNATSGEVMVETGTQRAYIPQGSRLAIRVDDYGNAFNYCTEGAIRLFSKKNNSEMTLNAGEYIAVTVKRGFRVLDTITEEDVTKMGIGFTDAEDLPLQVNASQPVGALEADFSKEGEISKINSNSAFVISNTANKPWESIVYADCSVERAVLCVYNTELGLVGSSTSVKTAVKPNVTLLGENENKYIVCVFSNEQAEYSFMNQKYVSSFGKFFDGLKKMAIPFAVALAIFFCYELISRKVTKKPKF